MPINYYATSDATSSTSSTWSFWCEGDGTSSPSGTVWKTWTNATTATTTEWPSATAFVWNSWNDNGNYQQTYYTNLVSEAQTLTEEEKRQQAKQEKQLAYNALRRKRRADAKEKAKEEKARQLLKEVLTDEQDQQLDKDGYFELVSIKSGQRYRINKGRSRNVEKIDVSGKVVKTLCFHPREYVHNYDTMTIQKLMLENDEEQVLKVANFS
jgi:hypothetical protein